MISTVFIHKKKILRKFRFWAKKCEILSVSIYLYLLKLNIIESLSKLEKKIKNLWDDPFTNGQHIYILDS